MIEYFLHISILMLLYVMLTQSLVLTSGYSGLISLAHAGFYGIGAYVSAILSVKYGLTFLISLPIAMIVSGLIAIIISTIALRAVDDYFIIITLGIQVVVFSIMNNWVDITNGPLGISGIPTISFFGLSLENKQSFLLLTLILTGIVFILIRNITKSPLGRVLLSLSEDEVFTKSLGKKVYSAKIISFALGGVLASIPGAIYAHYVSYIDPSSFTVNESIFILSIVIIAGSKSLWKVAFATAFLVILPELLRFVGMSSNLAANVRQILYGAALVFIMFNYGKRFLTKPYIGEENKYLQ